MVSPNSINTWESHSRAMRGEMFKSELTIVNGGKEDVSQMEKQVFVNAKIYTEQY